MMDKETGILVVEDDAKLGATIRDELISNGYDADLAYDGKVAEALFFRRKYDLVLLDINLPYSNGWELCAKFREHDRKVPIIMLTALGELDDKMDAFNAGADDYMVKPFHFKEMLARIKVFLKRHDSGVNSEDVLTVADLKIDMNHKSVTRSGKDISLTAKEFALLELLVRSRGRVISKMEIAEKIWSTSFDTGTNTIEVYINFLRNKVDKPFGNPLIHTKTGFGYYLKDENEY